MYNLSFEEFEKIAQRKNLIPVYREILADVETPVSALMKLANNEQVFLLESVEGGEKWGRYTFLGTDPRVIFTVRGSEVIIRQDGSESRFDHGGKPLQYLKGLLSQYQPADMEDLPRFYGGAVGFLSYDTVRYFERLPARAEDKLGTDDAVFLITDKFIIFDNVRHTIKVVACVFTGEQTDLRTSYDGALETIEILASLLITPVNRTDAPRGQKQDVAAESNMTKQDFLSIAGKAKDYIAAGDVIQVVLSQRFRKDMDLDPVDAYRALRYINPSPYLFFLKIDDFYLIGSSPEVMVRLEEGTVEVKPIAGTRRRGKTEQEDRRLADELLKDPKERAEHIMLVDLGRNDLGRIAKVGSVQVSQLMTIERYSHVMHLVSSIQALLSPGKDCFDVLQATFPAGTLTGAPKIRAMEIIEELEPIRRGPYGGAVGYFSYSGNMDFCITIRTLMIKDGTVYVQAGAGIVSDSDPEAEYQETVNKAKGMMKAIEFVANDFKITGNA